MMKKEITLSINPTYFCNFRCSFCYLSNDQLSDRKKIDLEQLHSVIESVSHYFEITGIDLYGGEVNLLRSDYLYNLKNVMSNFTKSRINLITNGSYLNDFCFDEAVDVSVSWDYLAREKHDLVLENISNSPKPVHILTLASEKFCKLSDGQLRDYISLINQSGNVKSVEIKPYSLNQFHQQEVKFTDYEKLIQRLIKIESEMKFEFINLKKIEMCLTQQTRAWSDGHLYITPDGSLAVLEFDHQGKEFFLKLNSVQEYISWSDQEKLKVLGNSFCSQCQYMGRCLSEHLQDVKSLEESCNGFINLLRWYENERV